MNIQVGEIIMDRVERQRIMFPNKSRKYLLACLREYGNDFANKLSNVFKVAVGLGDIVIKKRGFKHEKHLFILVDADIANKHFIEWLTYIKEHEAYQDDYFYGNVNKGSYHMFVIKFPEEYYDAFETFKFGEYSKMFKKADIDKFFSMHTEYKKVLVKDEGYKLTFVGILKDLFGVQIRPDEISGELDLPPTEESEIFNTHLK